MMALVEISREISMMMMSVISISDRRDPAYRTVIIITISTIMTWCVGSVYMAALWEREGRERFLFGVGSKRVHLIRQSLYILNHY